MLLVALLGLVALGCTKPEQKPAGRRETSLEGVQLKLLVVDDPALAAAAEGVRGEWAVQTGAEFEVIPSEAPELLDSGRIEADAVIGPAALIGPLAERNQLAPLPANILQREQGPWPDLFGPLRGRQAVWGGEVYGVPFGSPMMTCYYRADLLEKIGRLPPDSWEEYREVAQLLADRSKLGDAAPPDDEPWCGAIEPLAPDWAGLTLLARAIPSAKHRDNLTALFDYESMKPLVAGEPFVRALKQMVAVTPFGPETPQNYDPAAVRAAFWQGRCGLALTWPSGAKQEALPSMVPPDFRVGILELFGSQDVFDAATQRWETRGTSFQTHVTLLDLAGRIGLVAAESDQREATFQLLFWLSDGELGTQIAASSPATMLFRQSQLAAPGPWVEPPFSEATAADYAEIVDRALRRDQIVFVLRIPGRQAYLQALDEGVLAAVRGEADPAEALQKVAEKWQAITERVGVEKQRAAYHRSLALQ